MRQEVCVCNGGQACSNKPQTDNHGNSINRNLFIGEKVFPHTLIMFAVKIQTVNSNKPTHSQPNTVFFFYFHNQIFIPQQLRKAAVLFRSSVLTPPHSF